MNKFLKKKLLAVSLLSFSTFSQAAPIEVTFSDLSHPQANQFLEQTFDNFLNNPSKLDETLSDDFVQVFGTGANGRADFLAHAKVLSESISGAKIHFEDVNVDSSGVISETHTITLTKKGGGDAELRFLAFYYFKDGKLAKVDELYTLVKGSSEDRDLGSRIK
ncbi:nuclear transport factor 2 family protein [Moritella sp. 5]|uniref:nuclear transport factor 2 family protein n=1 Tax=Moritella sp. 5 TaxID=2746231 RepID=UPI001BAD7E4A|nr:nuclear transport factor 2 family protein [Moritella sp. 5]QUM81997.1 nuclear transport factor 2 family protein [Moritella sp. 5]